VDELSHWEGKSRQEWQALWQVPRLHILANTGSTNDDVRSLIESGAPDGSVVIAERQTAGRGQHGRTWHGVFGKSLHLSTAFRPSAGDFADLPAAPVRVGLAVARELSALTALPFQLKWPNDLILRGRKTGGILCEGIIGRKPLVVIGIGINVGHSRDDLPRDLQDKATSLAIEGAQFTRADVAGAVINALRGIQSRIAEPLNGSEIVSFNELDALQHQRVFVDDAGPGIAAGIARSGALLFELNGTITEVRTGTVRVG
jgi:BirA family biotin operon repressor/biotin-[acetyl-CoA-carboxylase] ligase